MNAQMAHTTSTDFIFKDKHVRVVLDDNKQPWFVAKDVCDALEYKKSKNAVSKHCKGAPKWVPLCTPGGIQNMQIINESNVYRLVMRSKMKLAEEFQDWIVEEVIPDIRKTGAYLTDHTFKKIQDDPSYVDRLLKDIEAHKRLIEEKDENERRMVLEREEIKKRARELKEKNEQDRLRAEEERQKNEAEIKLLRDTADRIRKVNEELIEYKTHNTCNESIYIISSRAYAKAGLFKIGRTTVGARNRVSSLNTGHAVGDDLVVLDEFKVHNATTLEKHLHATLEPLRASKNREFFVGRYILFKQYVSAISTNDDASFKLANYIINMLNKEKCNLVDINPMDGIDESAFDPPKITKLNLSMSLNDDKSEATSVSFSNTDDSNHIVKVVNDMLLQYMRKLTNDPKLSDIKTVAVRNTVMSWKDFKTCYQKMIVSNKLPVLKCRQAFASILDESNIKYRLRCARSRSMVWCRD